MAQYQSFKQVEEKSEEALDTLTIYYKINSLRAHPETTSHCVPSQEQRGKQIAKSGVELNGTRNYPKNLGVTLDMLLCYKQHTEHENEGGYTVHVMRLAVAHSPVAIGMHFNGRLPGDWS